MSTAILLAAFGSRHPQSRAALEAMVHRVRQRYPNAACGLCYTSGTIRDHLARRGEEPDSADQALERLLGQGLRRVAVQSLHMIPGEEFHNLLTLANRLMLKKGGFERIEVGFPLLAGEEDIQNVARALLRVLPEHSGPGEAVLLMGHGTPHAGNVYYQALESRLRRTDPDVYVGAMDADPGISAVCDRLVKDGRNKVQLMPLLFGAGMHAATDMTGEGPDSWKNTLSRRGIDCLTVLKGAAEHEPLADIWLAHLDDAVRRLERR
ncbi:MAG: sirohydrochlorin cobaltochelatase [Desulfovibrionaceae bacterium]|nr:sirohydrochlorin cobaltochelatase [Desulfovibrionaceae bacterium]